MFSQVFESGFWHCVTEIKDSKRNISCRVKILFFVQTIVFHGVGFFWGGGGCFFVGCLNVTLDVVDWMHMYT